MARLLGRAWGLWILVGVLAGCGSALPEAGPDYVRSTAGGYILADPPPGMTVWIGAKPVLNAADAAAMSDLEAADPARAAAPR
jgi:hypothetical protein